MGVQLGGNGRVKPRTVFNGGDPTGLVRKIRWYSWGVAHAVGSGITNYVGPHQGVLQGTQERAKIVLFQLGRCNGRRAYDAIDCSSPSTPSTSGQGPISIAARKGYQ